MADDAAFCGDRLRLSSFLLAAAYMPERPFRFRRSLLGEPQNEVVAHDSSSTQIQQVNDPMPTQTSPVSHLVDLNENLQAGLNRNTSPFAKECLPSTSISQLYTANSDTHSKRNMFDIDADDQAENETVQTISKQQLSHLPNEQAAKKKITTVNTSSLSKSAVPLQQGSDIRQRLWLPVERLALVRTSTADCLPKPGSTESTRTISTMNSDPIEDSQVRFLSKPTQTVRLQAVSLLGHPQSDVVSQRETLLRSQHIGSTAHRQNRGRFGASPYQRYSKVNRSLRRSRAADMEVLSDGFAGREISFYSAPSKRRTAKRNSDRKEKKSCSVLGGLPLAEGLLPMPSTSITTFKGKSGFANVVKSKITSGPVRPSSTKAMQIRDRPTASPPSDSGGSFVSRSNSITNQLSNITAPVRNDSESEASELAEDLPVERRGNTHRRES